MISIKYNFFTSIKKKEKALDYFYKQRRLKYKKNLEIIYLIFNSIFVSGIIWAEIYVLTQYVISNKDLSRALQISIYIASALFLISAFITLMLPEIINLKQIFDLEKLEIKKTEKLKENEKNQNFQDQIIQRAGNFFNSDAKKEFFLVFFNYCKYWYSDEKNQINTFQNIFELEKDLSLGVIKEMKHKFESLKKDNENYEKFLENFKHFMILQFFILNFSSNSKDILEKFIQFMKNKNIEIEIVFGEFNQITKIKYDNKYDNKELNLFDNFLNKINFKNDLELEIIIQNILEFLNETLQDKENQAQNITQTVGKSIKNSFINFESLSKLKNLIENMQKEIDKNFLINFEKKINTIIAFYNLEEFSENQEIVNLFNKEIEKINQGNGDKRIQKINNFSDIFQLKNEEIKKISEQILVDPDFKDNKSFFDEKLEIFSQELLEDEGIENYRSNLNLSEKLENKKPKDLENSNYYQDKNGVFYHNLSSFILKNVHGIIGKAI